MKGICQFFPGFARRIEHNLTGYKSRLFGKVKFGKAGLDYAPLFDRGVISINEFRKAVGLEPDENNPLWEQHFLNAGLVPLELAGIADLGRTEEEAQRSVRRFLTLPPEKLLTEEAGKP